MNNTDQELLDAYNEGWFDCSKDLNNKDLYDNAFLKNAYIIGYGHYLLGDDVRSFDYLSDEEILKIIKDA